MSSTPLVSPHDPVGSNLFGHVLRGRLMRVVPRENEAINETWLADRDRFSYEGVYSPDRLMKPLVRRGTEWVVSDWESALVRVAGGLRERAGSLGVLVSPGATLEELYLSARLARALKSDNVDHRLRQRDFRDQAADPAYPGLGMAVAAIDSLDALLLIGSNLRREAPILAHRVRKAARRGAQVLQLNPAAYPFLFPVKSALIAAPRDWIAELAGVLAAAAELAGTGVPEPLRAIVQGAKPSEAQRAIAQGLMAGEKRAIWLGALAGRHGAFADLRALAAGLAQLTGATLGRITEGGNAAGAYVAGAVPHREAGGAALAHPGLSAAEMLTNPLRAYLLVGGLEPSSDALEPESLRTLGKAEFVVAVTPYASEDMKAVAHVLLPMGTFAETSGTYVNCEGLWQSHAGAVAPLGEARPGWKVLRVLGNLMNLPGFDYQSSEDVLEQLRARCASLEATPYRGTHAPAAGALASAPLPDVAMYQTDAVVRRARSLQKTREARLAPVTYSGS
jgi:NADH-quinone oxidoreductase subunit G